MRRVPRGSSTTRPASLSSRRWRETAGRLIGSASASSLDRPSPRAQQLDDRPAIRVAEGLERVAGGVERRRAVATPQSARIRLFFASWVTSASPSASISGGM